MSEIQKKNSTSTELKIQIPKHWRDALDVLAEHGYDHRSANDIVVKFISQGIENALSKIELQRTTLSKLRGEAHNKGRPSNDETAE